MPDPDLVVAGARYPDLRVWLVPDPDAGEPYGDLLAPALIIERRRVRAARDVFQPRHLDHILVAWGRVDEPVFVRYLRIVQRATTVERVGNGDRTVLIFDTADYRAHLGVSGPTDLSGERAEWSAWLDGDVYGALIEHRDGSGSWREIGSLFGLYGRAYAARRARELIGEYAAHAPTARATGPIRLMLDLDISHLPQDIHRQLSGFDGVIADETAYGWLMWVPPDPDAHADAYDHRIPAEVLAVQRHARAHGCDYVRFDTDADRVGDLPTWDW